MTEGKCPSCGAPIEFTAGTALVLVCPNCSTVVGRNGKALGARGKIGAIVPTDSPLQLHVHGRYDNKGYRVVGHVQKDHGAGPWDEWYVEFDDGERGWISESEGAFHLTFYRGEETRFALSRMRPGARFQTKDGERLRDFVVEEVGHARIVAAEGELPSDVDPTQDVRYVDATGQGGVFCTLDYGSEEDRQAEVFIGHQVELSRLGIPPDQLRPRVKKVALVQARCTECNGPLELRAPDRTRRVACPYCGALLDTTSGRLSFLEHLQKPDHEPFIPLGAKGTLDGTEWICIGFLVRSTEVEYQKYWWDEYLLYNRGRGFTWLMQSNGHWVFLKPLAAGDVYCVPNSSARHGNRNYRAFQSVTAVTEFVLGEFYWEVNAGERAHATEYISPPYSVNEDRTGNETSFTLGEYLAPEVVKRAFGLKELPPPHGIAPSQPNPAREKMASGFTWAAIYAAALLGLYMFFTIIAANKVVFDRRVDLPPGVRGGSPEAMFFSEPFEIPRGGNVRVELMSPVSNAWMGVQGDLVNEETNEITSFYTEASYYSGVDSDGSWSEGSREDTEYLSRVPSGRYTLRLTPYFNTSLAATYQLRMTADTPRFLWLFLGVLLLLIPPFFNLARSSSFETARWNESNLASGE